ncbi:MAG: hypothetical protein Q9170_007638 [Blastenia crenularia]
MKNLDLRIAGKYQLQRKIGDGGFGAVYIGTNVTTGEEVAIKLEHVYIDPSLLQLEVEVYKTLSGGTGIPRVYDYLFECEYRALVLDLLGPSLEDLFNFCGRKFSLKTVLMLVDQLLYRLEYIHSKNVIHRDIKPENFLMGTGRNGNQIYVTDMGLAIASRDAPETPNPVLATKRNLIGTAMFASIKGHLVQHRRDDLESLGYMLVYFLQGSLPWQSSKAGDETPKHESTLKMKETISTGDLCKDLPKEIKSYFDYVRSLEPNKTPAYGYLRKLFRSLFMRGGFEYDHVFDWTILKYLMSTEQMEIR